jgi:FkbH-like protein
VSAVGQSPLQRRLAWRKTVSGLPVDAPRVAVLATFTAQPLEALLGAALNDEGVPGRIHIGPYDQILAECLMVGSEIDQLNPNVLVIWPRLEDLWRALPVPLVDDLHTYVEALTELAVSCAEAASKWSATLVFVLPAHPELRPLGVGDSSNPVGVSAAWEAARLETRRVLAGRSGVLIADAEVAVRRLGVDQSFDPRTMTSARVPFSDALFSLMADDVARLVKLAKLGAKKLAVVDADNTLWGGVVGEDGADGIDLLDNGPGEAFRAFQDWLIELRRSGMIIGVASKNNEPELWEAFARRDMRLQRDQLAAWRVNWEPKPANIVAMVDELNLGLSSVVFIDDNPVELAQVHDALPEVATLQMPQDPSLWQRELARSGLLDRLPPTLEDLGRAQSYAAETVRRVVRTQMSPDEYLASLDINVDLTDPGQPDLARLAQLVAKTNQFTLGGPRHDEATLAALIEDPSVHIRLVSVVDRFGDYGIVGATICRITPQPTLDTFVLSCRAMGRGVEEAMLSDACAIAGGSINVTVLETARNSPGRTFFAIHGASVGEPSVISQVIWPSHVGRFSGGSSKRSIE